MIEPLPQLLIDNLVFPEGLRWHQGELWFSDMWDGKVWRVTSKAELLPVADVPNRPSGMGFLPDGTPVVVSMADRKLLAITPTGPRVYADLSDWATGDVNDLLIDAQGHTYVGNFGYDLFGGAEMAPAGLHMVRPDGRIEAVACDLVFPNGMVLLGDGGTLVVAETWANRLTAFDRSYDGTLINRRVFAELDDRTPDGICIDAADGIWVSCFASGEVIRVLQGGQVTDRIAFPMKRAVACALGGEDGRTLYCATYAGEVEEIHTLKRAGAIETVRVEIGAQGQI